MPILDEMQDLKKELNLLIKILETKNTELNNTLTKKTPILDKFISDLSNENALLQSIHKKMDDRLSASISPNSAEADALNDAKLRKLEETYLKTTEKYAELFTKTSRKAPGFIHGDIRLSLN